MAVEHLPKSKIHAKSLTKKKGKNALKRAKLRETLANKVAQPNKPSFKAIHNAVNLKNLNFDRERICSVTLSSANLFMCLTCGEIFQGQSNNTPAFNHSVDFASDGDESMLQHRIFIALHNFYIYQMPEMQELDMDNTDALLNLIKANCNPSVTDVSIQKCQSYLNHNDYYTGYTPLMSGATFDSHVSTVLHMLNQIRPLIKSILLRYDRDTEKTPFEQAFVNILKKQWNPNMIKPCVSLIEFEAQLQMAYPEFAKLPRDPRFVYLWMINHFSDKSVIQTIDHIMKGKIEVCKTPLDTQTLLPNGSSTKTQTLFTILSLDLPTVSVFKQRNLVSIHDSNAVQNTTSLKSLVDSKLHKPHVSKDSKFQLEYTVRTCPKYMVLHFNRFGDSLLSNGDKGTTRNKAIVEYQPEMFEFFPGSFYSLKYNLTYDNDSFKSQFAIGGNRFVELDGIKLKERDPNLLFLSESYMQLWELLET